MQSSFKTLEELFIAQYGDAISKAKSLETALDGAKHTIEQLTAYNEMLLDLLRPELRLDASGTDIVLDFPYVWKGYDGERFEKLVEAFGFDELYKELKAELKEIKADD